MKNIPKEHLWCTLKREPRMFTHEGYYCIVDSQGIIHTGSINVRGNYSESINAMREIVRSEMLRYKPLSVIFSYFPIIFANERT